MPFTKTQITKTTTWLKKHNISFDVCDDGVHVDRRILIPSDTAVALPALTKSGYVDVRENATFTAPALRTIGEVSYRTSIFGHEVEVHDGIGAVALSTKKRGDITVRRCRKAKFVDGVLAGDALFVVSHGEHNAHGETLESAMADLAFKTADRDVSKYQNMPLDTVKTPHEWAVVYRVITGACQFGTEDFMKSRGELKASYTLSEIIEQTSGAYGSARFREVVQA